MDTPTTGPNRGQAGHLKAILSSRGKAANFPVFLEVMKTRPIERSIECGSYPFSSSIAMKGYPRRHSLDCLSTC